MSKLFIDFDNTIVDSIKAYLDVYNKLTDSNVSTEDISEWDLSIPCPGINPTEIFERQSFFEYLEFMPKAQEVLKELSRYYEVIICTIGTFKNIEKKSKWIKENLPFIEEAVFLVRENVTMNKAIVDMGGAILIDDNVDNLISSNAFEKYVFGKVYEYNADSPYYRLTDWQEIQDYLLGSRTAKKEIFYDSV